jgi:lipopolysaccharide export system ATP-binding protein
LNNRTSTESTRHSLRAENLVKKFRKRTVVNDASFEVCTGQVIGLLGPNGAGKTTSFYMVVGLLFPHSGAIYLDGMNITNLPMHVRAQKGISYLPQNTSIFRRMTVEENLLSIMEVTGVGRSERRGFLEELLEKFRVQHIRNSLGASLSGGERRRVEIARALIIRPKFLLLDEPFAGIDPVTVQEIQGIIKDLRDDGIGVLITDHNVRETLGSCDKVFILSQGAVIASGLPHEISSNPVVRETYLGENFSV